MSGYNDYDPIRKALTMSAINTLKLACGSNIVILVPVCMSMYRPTDRNDRGVSEHRSRECWAATHGGEPLDRDFACIHTRAGPARHGEARDPAASDLQEHLASDLHCTQTHQRQPVRDPVGIATTFLLIVLTYPVIYWFATR
jgi:hypothetical protein